jgi:hypothetical protein
MADLTAANVTVILNPEDIDLSPDRVGRRTFPVISFGNGALLYPALGIPMPDLGKFGLLFAIKRVYIEQPASGYIYHFDRANHKLRIFLAGASGIAAASGGTPAGSVAAPVFTGTPQTPEGTVDPGSHVFTGTEKTPAGTNTAPAFTGSALATHTHVLTGGVLAELGAVAVAATTLYLELVGK